MLKQKALRSNKVNKKANNNKKKVVKQKVQRKRAIVPHKQCFRKMTTDANNTTTNAQQQSPDPSSEEQYMEDEQSSEFDDDAPLDDQRKQLIRKFDKLLNNEVTQLALQRIKTNMVVQPPADLRTIRGMHFFNRVLDNPNFLAPPTQAAMEQAVQTLKARKPDSQEQPGLEDILGQCMLTEICKRDCGIAEAEVDQETGEIIHFKHPKHPLNKYRDILTSDGVLLGPSKENSALIRCFEIDIFKALESCNLITGANSEYYTFKTLTPIDMMALLHEDGDDFTQDYKDLLHQIVREKLLPMHETTLANVHDVANAPIPFAQELLYNLVLSNHIDDNSPIVSQPNLLSDQQYLPLNEGNEVTVVSEKKLGNGSDAPTLRIAYPTALIDVKKRRSMEQHTHIPIEIKPYHMTDLSHAEIIGAPTTKREFGLQTVLNTVPKLNVHQLRRLTLEYFQQDLVMKFSFDEPALFKKFFTDERFGDENATTTERNKLRFFGAQIVTQLLLKAKFRNQEYLYGVNNAGWNPEDTVEYHSILLQTPQQWADAETEFMHKIPADPEDNMIIDAMVDNAFDFKKVEQTSGLDIDLSSSDE